MRHRGNQVYDGRDRLLSEWVGTNDTPSSGSWSPTNNTSPSNMVQVSGYEYDGAGVGDGYLTQRTIYPGASAASRVSKFYYDWRGRMMAEKDGYEASESTSVHRPIFYKTYDNLNEITQVQRYDGDGVSITSTSEVPNAPSSSLLRAETAQSFDDQGRIYKTQLYSVNPSSGSVSSTALTTNAYYNHRGQKMAVSAPGGQWTKSQFDGAGRTSLIATTDGAAGTTWSNASALTSDNVLQQSLSIYDANGNVIETITKLRFDDETKTKGDRHVY